MEQLTKYQKHYLEGILILLNQKVKNENINQEFFKEHFIDYYILAHYEYGQILKEAVNNDKVKKYILTEIYKGISINE